MKLTGRDCKVGCKVVWKISLAPTVWVILEPPISLLSHLSCSEECLNYSRPHSPESLWGPGHCLDSFHSTSCAVHLEPLLLSTHTIHWNLQDLYKAYSTFSTSKESFCCKTGTFTTPFCYIKGIEDLRHLGKTSFLCAYLGLSKQLIFIWPSKPAWKHQKISCSELCSATSSRTEGDFNICDFI